MRFPKQTLVLAFAVAVITSASLTGFSGNAVAEHDPSANYGTNINVGIRYPGDRALKEGTVRVKGPEKGAYIEKCRWGLNPNLGKGFGLTQSCVRYTLKNTHD